MNSGKSIIGFLCAFLTALFLLQWDGSALRILLWTIVFVATSVGIVLSLVCKKRTLGWTLVAIGIGITVSVLRVSFITQEVASNLPANTKVELMGWVSEIPEHRPISTRYVLTVMSMKNGNDLKSTRGKVLITDRSTWPAYNMGDYLFVQGTVEIPETIENFDYAKYLSVRGIDRVMDRVTIAKPSKQEAAPFAIRYSIARTLGPLRSFFEGHITRIFPEPHASLLIGLLTGGRTGLPQDLADDFRIAGLSHIVAISGYNITIILTLLSSALFFLPTKRRFWPLSIGITLFVIFVGAGAPVVRAGIMGVLGLIAIQADRVARPRQLILWTAFFMSIINPRELWYDPGFQLSFLATIGIAELGPTLKRVFSRVPENFGIRESLAATIAAEIATLPVAVLLFRQLSLVAPLTNLLVAPLIPLTMLTGFIATILGIPFQFLGLLAGTVAWGLLTLIISIVEFAASIPFAALTF